MVDGPSPDNDYSYDANGNMIADKNKAITSIVYNHLNLPEKVIKSDGHYIRYTYDATGRKLSQAVYNSLNALQKKTDYAGEYFYENDTLKFINHEEGRITMTGPEPEYQYHLKDHLGNVRLTFTTKPEVDEYYATLEDAHLTDERADFPNYDQVFTSGAMMYNHTDELNATRSVVLNGAQDKQVGLAKSLRIVPGDTVNMKVYAKYFVPSSSQDGIGTFIASSMTGAFGLTSNSIGLEHSAFEAISEIFNTGWFIGPDDWEDDNAPKAYLNYILFDEDFIPYDMGWDQISVDASTSSPHDSLKLQAVARKPGYIYIYFSNEDNEIIEVYFDDFDIRHIHSPVIQGDDYYPFGLTFNSYSRENSVDQKFKFQGQEHIDDLGLGWDSFKWRNHQPDIGRFFNVDPLAEKYYYNSPYAFSENKVISHRELEGLEAVEVLTSFSQEISNERAEPVFSKEYAGEIDHYNVTFTVTQSETYHLEENNMAISSTEKVTTSQHSIKLKGGGFPVPDGSKDSKVANFVHTGLKNYTVNGNSGTEVTTKKVVSTEGKGGTSVKIISNTGEIGLNAKNSNKLRSVLQKAQAQQTSGFNMFSRVARFLFGKDKEQRKDDTKTPTR